MASPARAAACRCRYASPPASETGSSVSCFLHTLVLLYEQVVQDDVGHARAVQGRVTGLVRRPHLTPDVRHVQRVAAVVRDCLVIRFSQLAKNSNFYRDKHLQEEDHPHANETHCDLRWP